MITIGSQVKVLEPVDGKRAVQFEKGQVIYVGLRALVQFNSNICGHSGNGLGIDRRCWMCDIEKIKEL